MLFIFAGLTLSILIQGLADTNSLFYESRHSICSLLIVACASLLINSRLKNPFVDLLNLLFFIFFILRAVTSLFIETQVDPIIARASASDLSGAIYFLNGCFVVLIFAVHIFSLNVDHRRVILSDLEKETVSWAIRISSIFILIDSSWAIYSFFNCLELNFLHSVSIYAIFKNIFLSAQSLLFLVALPIYYVDQIRRIDFGIIFISLAIFLIGNILSGGKSGVLLVALYFIIGIILGFRLYGSSYLRTHWRKILSISILLVALAPVAFTLGKAMRVIILGNFGCGSVAERSHSISSWKRAINGKAHELKAYFGARNAEISVGESSAKISVGESNKIAGASDFKLSQTLNAISGRTGFFDYYLEKYLNPDYADKVSWAMYYRAVVDKLTPGFEIYNEPFVSRSLYRIHHKAVSPHTNSEQMTLFGEAHILFGWVAPVFILVFCAFLGGLVRLGSWIFENFPLGRALFMIVMMRALYFWFEGFGIDMVIILRILHTGIFVLFILGMAYLVAREAVGRMRD